MASPSPRSASRRVLVLILAGLIGLCLIISPPTVGPPRDPEALPSDDPADVPIVAVRGEPLAPHEEPLPPGARVRIGTTWFRHPTSFHGQEPTAVGSYLVSIRDGVITLTDSATGQRMHKRSIGKDEPGTGNETRYHNLTASLDGRRFVIWDYGSAKPGMPFGSVWEVGPDRIEPVNPIASIHFPPGDTRSFIDRVTFTTDGRELILAGWTGILAYDLSTGALIRQIVTETKVLDVSSGGRWFVTASESEPLAFSVNGSFRLPTYRFRPPEPPLPGERLWSLTRTFEPPPPGQPVDLYVHDAITGVRVATIPMPGSGRHYPRHACLAPDGRFVAVNCLGSAHVWAVKSGQQVLHVPANVQSESEPPDYLIPTFTLDSRCLTVTGRADRVRWFDLATGRDVTRESEGLAAAGAVDPHGSARRIDPTSGRPLPLPPGYSALVMDYSPATSLIAVADATGRVDVWRTDGRLVRTLRNHGKPIEALAFSPDGRRLAACDQGRDLRVWSVGDWRERQRVHVPADYEALYPDRLVFSPDGRRLLVSRGDVLALWDLGTRKWLWDVPGHRFWSKTPSPVFMRDGSRVMRPGDKHWRDAASGLPSTPAPCRGRVRTGRRWDYGAVALSPSGSAMAFVDVNRELQLTCVFGNAGFPPFPQSTAVRKEDGILRYSPDGRRLVTCDDHGHAHVWEVATGSLAFTLSYPDGDIADVHVGSDGRTLITANHREVIVWVLDPEPGEAGDLWGQLGYPDAAKSEPARRRLLADPAGAVRLFRERLQPATPADPGTVRRQIRALDAEDYRDRERAAAGLRSLGRRALPFLREARPQAPEARARVQSMIAELAAGPTTDELRLIRAVEILNLIRSPDAQSLLTELAVGDPAAVLTEEASKR